MSEAATIDQLLCTVQGIDYDFGTDGDIKYSISGCNILSFCLFVQYMHISHDPGGDAPNNFYMEASLGELRLKSALDFETLGQNPMVVEVTLRDGAFVSKSATTSITIAVTDENDNVPSCIPSAYVVSLDEDMALGSQVWVLCG